MAEDEQTPRPYTRRSAYFTRAGAPERTASARHAANARWAREPDRRAALKPAIDARLAGYYRAADEQGITDPKTREAMARNAQRAEMARLRRIQLTRKRQAEAAAGTAARDGEAS